MKNVISSVLMLLIVVTSTANSKKVIVKEKEAKVIVMVNTASWCPACQGNGARVEKEVLSSYMKNPKVTIVVNDLSNEETKKVSKASCDKAGITTVAQTNVGTGMIYFIDAKTKKVLSQISVTKTTEEINAAFKNVIEKA